MKVSLNIDLKDGSFQFQINVCFNKLIVAVSISTSKVNVSFFLDGVFFFGLEPPFHWSELLLANKG